LTYLKTLSERCRPSFQQITMLRGEAYFETGKVTKVEFFEEGLRAQVIGKQPYRVSIYWGRASKYVTMPSSCDCPNFRDGNLCKHIWAVILEADKFSLNVITRSVPLQVLHSPEADRLLLESSKRRALHAATILQSSGLPDNSLLKKIKGAQKNLPTVSGRERGFEKALGPLVDSSKYYYTFDLAKLKSEKKFVVSFYFLSVEDEKKQQEIHPAVLRELNAEAIQDPSDQHALSLLFSFNEIDENHYNYSRYRADPKLISIEAKYIIPSLYALTATGRFFKNGADLKDHVKGKNGSAVEMDLNRKFSFELFVSKESEFFKLQGRIIGDSLAFSISEINYYADSGLFLVKNQFYRFEAKASTLSWLEALIKSPKKFIFKDADIPLFLETTLNGVTPVVLPPELQWPIQRTDPKVRALFQTEPDGSRKALFLKVEFDYGFKVIPSFSPLKVVVDKDQRKIYERNLAFEKEVLKTITELGAEDPFTHQVEFVSFRLQPQEFVKLVQKGIELGWTVEAEGKKIRTASDFNIKVSSGVDWFDLDAKADFDGMQVALPTLLAAIEKRQQFVVLDDGTVGMLPQEWLTKYASLASLGSEQDGLIRFRSNQAILIDAWLDEEKNLTIDAVFKKLREKIRKFDGIKPEKEPETFNGKLRPYQRQGLSWFNFLEEFGFGGILADDMGLGKTIQCLAFFEKRRIENLLKSKKDKSFRKTPSLVVVPKSLIFNWIDEATSFADKLKVLNYTGTDRRATTEQMFDYDIIITTYQTLRLDIEKFKEIEFDAVVIDEAQAIKNEGAQVSKATKLLKARFRLAMTGTPVENSLNDLFSITDFVNPGLLGKKAYDKLATTIGEKGPSKEALKSLSIALKPFILRRTKAQVLKDLPEKTEQVVSIELSETQKNITMSCGIILR
jgi:hypothetical protein